MDMPVVVQVLFALGLLAIVVVRFAALRRGGSLDPLAQLQAEEEERRRRQGGADGPGDAQAPQRD